MDIGSECITFTQKTQETFLHILFHAKKFNFDEKLLFFFITNN